MINPRELFEENGVISANLEGYEVRQEQLEMVSKVQEAIETSSNLIVEAGTGVGKSLAYLVPFIQWAVQEEKKVVISTFTKALQNQLYVKDLPFLRDMLGIDLRYAMCMGSENYVCLRKTYHLSAKDKIKSKKLKKEMRFIMNWIETTETGLVIDMDFVPDKTAWAKVSRESDRCAGKKCPYNTKCFHKKARIEQSKSHVLITNHALLFTDMTSPNQVLPEFHGLVLDEAHTLEDIATNHFSREFSNAGTDRLVSNIGEFISGNLFSKGKYSNKKEGADNLIRECDLNRIEFFDKVKTFFGEEEGVKLFDKGEILHEELAQAFQGLSDYFFDLQDVVSEEDTEDVKMYAEKCRKLCEDIDFIFSHDNAKHVDWLNVKKWKTSITYSFHTAPTDISDHMRLFLFDKISPVVLTSATLSVSGTAGNFDFIRARLGLDVTMELLLDSPFDYQKNVLLYLAKDDIDPNKNPEKYLKKVIDSVKEIYDVMGGRMFVLFTSYSMLNAVSDAIAIERDDIYILRQGDLPRYVLLDVFKKNKNSVLMGTTTFWQGVDVTGDALECVVITKLPFSVPSDPINAARIKDIREAGRNPFMEYQVPQAVIMFKQGFGRLIRSRKDTGVVAMLDSRVNTRRYGQMFIDALPECKRTNNFKDIEGFFGDEVR